MDTVVIGICDDQEIAYSELVNIVKHYCIKRKIKFQILSFSNGEIIKKMQLVNILFLDTEMTCADGMEIGKLFFERNKECKIIIETSREDRVKEYFKINAFRFISKPYQIAEIEEALDSSLELFINLDVIQLYDNRTMHEILQKDVLYIEAYDGYIEAKVGNITMRRDCTLLKMEDMLNSDYFFRVNKSCIVNLMKIDSYKKRNIRINEKNILVARRRRKEFELVFYDPLIIMD